MRFSALFCALLALPLLPQASHAADFELTIVHANDTHSAAAGIDDRYAACREDDACTGGYARIVEAVEALRKENPAVLALDAGDFWQGTHFFRTGGPEWALAAMKRMPWDAVTLGNHEFDAGCAETVRYVENLPMPVVAANILPNPKCPMSRAPLKPYVVKTVGGVRVGVVGLANDEERKSRPPAPPRPSKTAPRHCERRSGRSKRKEFRTSSPSPTWATRRTWNLRAPSPIST